MEAIDIIKIKAILPHLASDVAYDDFKPHIESAQDWISDEILGSTIYANILDDTISDAKLIRLVETITILKGYSIGIPSMDLIQTPDGFAVVNDANRSPASKQRVDRLIAQNQLRLDTAIDSIINHLEDNATYHNDWKSSPSYSFLSDCLINTVREFKRYAKFNGSREDFLDMKPSLINSINIKLAPYLSKAYISELLAKQSLGTLSDFDKAIIEPIKQALASLMVNSNFMAESLIADAVNIMDNDLDNYPTYSNSQEYSDKSIKGHENAADDTIFVSSASI